MDGVRWRLKIVTLEVLLDDTTFSARSLSLSSFLSLFSTLQRGGVGEHACYWRTRFRPVCTHAY